MRLCIVVACAACATPATSETAKDTAQTAPTAPRVQAAKPAPAKPADPYAAHIEQLKQKLTAKGIANVAFVVEEPFVVIGDTSEAQLRREAQTVRWAADLLEQDFFAARPTTILNVYLFHGAASYERGVKRLTGEDPGTPYGFYSRTHGGLFMDIETGGGTLVHEIVHPYVEADLGDAPAWINEGLGSLFEQSAEQGGHIVGRTNWRLAGLQRAIANGGVPSFDKLAHYDDTAFYGDDSGVNYAAARYLMYYLQERGVVRDFYAAVRANRAKDPTGYKTLVATLGKLGETDMAKFEASWRAYVAKLTFP